MKLLIFIFDMHIIKHDLIFAETDNFERDGHTDLVFCAHSLVQSVFCGLYIINDMYIL